MFCLTTYYQTSSFVRSCFSFCFATFLASLHSAFQLYYIIKSCLACLGFTSFSLVEQPSHAECLRKPTKLNLQAFFQTFAPMPPRGIYSDVTCTLMHAGAFQRNFPFVIGGAFGPEKASKVEKPSNVEERVLRIAMVPNEKKRKKK